MVFLYNLLTNFSWRSPFYKYRFTFLDFLSPQAQEDMLEREKEEEQAARRERRELDALFRIF